MGETNNIRQILKDFKPFEPEPVSYSKFVALLPINYNPPAYMVQMLLLGILGFKDYGIMDKVLWHTYFEYKNYPFMVMDYKFGSWTIEGIRNNKEMMELAEEIRNKIIKASKVLDRILYKDLKTEVGKGKFYLNNVFRKLSSIYYFYEEKTLDAIKKYEEIERNESDTKNYEKISDYITIQNTKLIHERIISNYSFALMPSFFSLLEFLLDVIYAFQQPAIKFSDYKNERWNERFKLVFGLDSNKKLKWLYDELINIKNNYRNPLIHGLINEVNLLVPLPYIGLVPLSYEYLSRKTHYGIVEIKKDNALNIIKIFKEFLKFMKTKKPYKFYMLYLSYDFPIPMDPKDIYKIKKEMTAYKNFKEYLEDRADYEDMIINRDI